MRASTRERILRTLLSAFINSTLTPQELEELSEEISHNTQFQEDLRRALRAVSSVLRDERKHKELNPSEVSPLDHVFALVKRRRWSKDEVLRAMNRAAPGLMGKPLSDNLSLKEIVQDFWAKTSEVERSRFMSLLPPKGLAMNDEYLQGINNRRE